MSKLNKIIKMYPDIKWLFADGFNNAIIGIANDKIVYSRTGCIKILMDRDGMSYEVASEFFNFNVEGAYVGKKTPIWVDDELFNNNIPPNNRTFDDIE
jgi:predicted RNase H-like nuclease (RuvC/YqgF family)